MPLNINKKEIATRKVAEQLFKLAVEIFKKFRGDLLEMPALKSEPSSIQGKMSFEYYCLLHSMISLIAWNSLDATKAQRNEIIRFYFEICREDLMRKAKNKKQGEYRCYSLELRRDSYEKAYNTKTNMGPFYNCGQLFRKNYDLIQYYSDPAEDKAGLSDKDIATMPNWWLEKYIEEDNEKESQELLNVKENINLPFQKIAVAICNELEKIINAGYEGVSIKD